MTHTYPQLDNSVLVSHTPTLLSADKWTVREMQLTKAKIAALWTLLQEYKTLFSDQTRGNFENFARLLTTPYTYWLEIYEDSTLVGVVYFEELQDLVDAQAHLVILDRRPMEKLEVCAKIIRYIFSEFSVNRITVRTPELYHATIRLLERLGFSHEGTKREAVQIGGEWLDVIIFGLLRSEVPHVVPFGQDSVHRTRPEGHSRPKGKHSWRVSGWGPVQPRTQRRFPGAHSRPSESTVQAEP